jgi:hypothetical protein
MTDSTPHPDVFVPVIMGLAESPSMADDRVVVANRTLPRQEVQRDHPGSILSFVSGSAIKRTTAGREGRPQTVLPSSIRVAGLHPPDKSSVERKKNTAFGPSGQTLLHCKIGRYIGS